MRKLLISLLLASAVTSPALAAQRDRDAARAEREQAREERQQAREERRNSNNQSTAASSSSAPAEAPQARAPREPRADRAPTGGYEGRAELQRMRDHSAPAIGSAPVNIGTAPAATNADQRRAGIEQRRQQRDAQHDAARQARIERQQALRNSRPPVVSPTPRPGTQPPPPPVTTRPSTHPTYNWSSNHWRNDRRYDWYNYRNKYWWLFQLGSYYDPFGWGYQPYQVGWRMWPSYYSSNYWINDPYYFRLPYAPPGYRWVRYWDDAVLVDTWSGQVVDVIYNFFW